MIDLSHTRSGFLAEIEAPDPAGGPLSDITDPRVARTDAHVRVWGYAREDLFPLLQIALSERFAAVPRLRLTRDLLMPLKHALGNACRHGNGNEPGKTVSVEIVMTRKGALIALTDEGPGFDVALTFRRFQQQQDYFVHRGGGFRSLDQAMSTVSYENGGRTVLLCYRPTDPDRASSSCAAPGGDPTTASGEFPGAGHTLPKVLDPVWIQTCLSAEMPEFAGGRARIESCRVYATGGRGDDCGNRYVLRVAGHDGGVVETRVLTGRPHASEAAAAADFEAATRLHEAKISKSVLIPRPVARPAGEPHLVLYDFDPWMSLWEYLTYRQSLKALRHCAKRIGGALARLHRSQVVLRGVEPDSAGDGLQGMVARAETTLQTLPSGPDLVNRFRVCIQRIRERSASWMQRTVAPIHGALAWDCIHYGADGNFYLYRFERCRRSDPGLDLGGFAADLLCFTLADHEDGAYRICSDAFLSHYNSEAEHPMLEDDLCLYVVLVLSERLQRAAHRTKARAGELLAALDAALRDGAKAAANGVSS